MKIILTLFLTTFFLFSSQIEVKSSLVTADDAKGVTTFTGNVVITRGSDTMKADKVNVFLNKDREIYKFEASGNTYFLLSMESNQTFEGVAEEFTYFPIRQEFILRGNATVEDITNKRKLIGNEIIFDEKTKKASVKGKETEPVKVIFTIADKNESKKDE